MPAHAPILPHATAFPNPSRSGPAFALLFAALFTIVLSASPTAAEPPPAQASSAPAPPAEPALPRPLEGPRSTNAAPARLPILVGDDHALYLLTELPPDVPRTESPTDRTGQPPLPVPFLLRMADLPHTRNAAPVDPFRRSELVSFSAGPALAVPTGTGVVLFLADGAAHLYRKGSQAGKELVRSSIPAMVGTDRAVPYAACPGLAGIRLYAIARPADSPALRLFALHGPAWYPAGQLPDAVDALQPHSLELHLAGRRLWLTGLLPDGRLGIYRSDEISPRAQVNANPAAALADLLAEPLRWTAVNPAPSTTPGPPDGSTEPGRLVVVRGQVYLIAPAPPPPPAPAPANATTQPAADPPPPAPAPAVWAVWRYDNGWVRAAELAGPEGPLAPDPSIHIASAMGQIVSLRFDDAAPAEITFHEPSGAFAAGPLALGRPNTGTRIEGVLLYRLVLQVIIVIGACIALWSMRREAFATNIQLPDGLQPATTIPRIGAFMVDFLPAAAAMVWLVLPQFPALERVLNTAGAPADVYHAIVHQLTNNERWMLDLLVLACFASYALYATAWEMMLGYTPGKRLFGLRVVDEAGAEPTFRQMFLRGLIRLVEVNHWTALLLAVAILNPRRQRVGDVIARTMVIRASSHQQPDTPHPNGTPKPPEPPEPPSPR